MSNEIPIVFGTDDNYAPYMGVAIKSLINHVNDDNIYKIYVLTRGIKKCYESAIRELASEKENVYIDFVDVSYYYRNLSIPPKALSVSATYRLCIDKIFEQYKTVLYLDCDIIIKKDVAELFRINIDNYILGATVATMSKRLHDRIKNIFKIDPGKYFNSGVLLINIKEFKERDIGTKCLEMLNNNPDNKYHMDQDVLNVCTAGKVKYIDPRWNAEWAELTCAGKAFFWDCVPEEKRKAIVDPFIIHYITRIKPWNNPGIRLAEEFWEIAEQTAFYFEIKMRNRAEELFKYQFPWHQVERGAKIIIYGGGNVGKAFIAQVFLTSYCDIICVCDRDYENRKEIFFPKICPEDLREQECDYIVVAIENESVREQIAQELSQEYQISPNRIKWDYQVFKK